VAGGDSQPRVRLRQAVLVARELEPVAGGLRSALELQEPFRDPGVSEFGLTNAVFALGDCFLEVVSPARAGTTAGRYLDRHGGDGGYMVIFDLEDLDGARERVRQSGIRVVWQIDLPDISGTHLHPADMRGAIVSLDRSSPYGSWRWGGPQWTGKLASGAPGRLAGITVAVADPDAVAARWAHVLGVPVRDGARPTLALDGAEVVFTTAADAPSEGLIAISHEPPPGRRGERQSIVVGGVSLLPVPAAELT
jgi:Glyoxalase-like domain